MISSRHTLLVYARLVFLAVLAVAFGFTVNAFVDLSDVQNRIRYRIPENTIWSAAQSEIELARTLSRLAPLAYGAAPEGDKALDLQFELLWSRSMIFRSGTLAKVIESEPAQKAIFEQYTAALEEADKLIKEAVSGNRIAAAQVLEILEPHREKLRSLTMASLNADRHEREMLSANNDLLQMQLSRFGSATIALLLLLLIFLILAERRARQLLEDANQSRSNLEQARSLSEAQAQRMELLAKKATAASVAKTEFLAMMSHDIRTPLNAIIGLSELMLQKGLPGEVHRMSGTILRASEGLLTLINDILDLTRLEAGKLPLKPAAFSLQALAEEVREVAAVLAEGNGNHMVVGIDPALPEMVVGDGDRIRQILLNLAGNANKFTHEGEVGISFDLLSHGSEGYTVRFAVSDTGSGISQELRGRLFQPFEQGENARNVQGHSTGLGLTISERLVRLMDGKIRFDSEPGKGTTFSFDIPLEKVSPEQEALYVAPSSKRGNASFAGKRVLIADDTPTNLMVACSMFETFDAEIETAKCGDEAIAIGRARSFDLVVLDVQMPGTDGVGAMKALRKEAANPNAVYVALTAQSFTRDRDRLLAAGFDHYLSKPVRLADIGRLLEQISEDQTTAAMAALASPTAGMEQSLPEDAAAEPASADKPDHGLDTEFLDGLRDDLGPQTLTTLVNQVHNEVENALVALKSGAAENRNDDVRKIAHQLAGLMDQFGVSAAANSARNIENGQAPNGSLPEIEELIEISRIGLLALRNYIKLEIDNFGIETKSKPVSITTKRVMDDRAA